MGRLPKKFGLTKSSALPGDQYDLECSVTTCTAAKDPGTRAAILPVAVCNEPRPYGIDLVVLDWTESAAESATLCR